jgi:segregation and condensation protein A
MKEMSIGNASHQASSYKVATPVYEGPLDLLLQLIERAELDITKLALAQVTDQYLEYLKNLSDRATEEVSAFLVIASRLLQIKSEVLLPRMPLREAGEDDPGEALARQLLAYKRFKAIASYLEQREAAGLRSYLRLAHPPKVEFRLDMNDLDLSSLVEAAQTVLSAGIQTNLRPSLDTVVAPRQVTIRQKINLIAKLLHERGRITFRTILGGAHSRLEVMVTFLAMLELVKSHFIHAYQDSLFGEIELEADASWKEDEEFELEFGEF